MTEFFIPSCGRGRIHCVKWEPEGKACAVVQIVHGISEYVERYGEFAAFLNSKGIVVVGEDHMGHGKSVENGLSPVYFYGGWTSAVDDILSLQKKTRAEYPNVPYVLFGHSMGSFLTRTFLYRCRNRGMAAAALCGTGWMPRPILTGGKAAAAVMGAIHGEDKPCPALNRVMFGTYNRGYGRIRTPFDWLNRDEAAVDAYIADPMCGGIITPGLARDMITGIGMNQKRRNLSNMDPGMPVLFLAGDQDPVGSWGKGVSRTAEEFQEAGMKDVEVRLYPGGRHEILNEPIRQEVYFDFWDWLCRKVL